MPVRPWPAEVIEPLRLETPSSIGDGHRQVIVCDLEGDVRLSASGVAGNVVQRLLHDPVGGVLDRRWQPPSQAGARDVDLQPDRRQLFGPRLDGGNQPQILEHCRPQVLADAANTLQRAVDQVVHGVEPPLGRRWVGQVERQQIELTTDHDQRLHRLVVEVAGQAGALLGRRQLARLRRQAPVLDCLGELAGQASKVGHILRRKRPPPIALDIQDANRAPAREHGYVELGACPAAWPGQVLRLQLDVVDQPGRAVLRDPAGQAAAERNAEGAWQQPLGWPARGLVEPPRIEWIDQVQGHRVVAKGVRDQPAGSELQTDPGR